MQQVLQDLELPSIKLLKKVVDNAQTGDEKFLTLKHDNEACRTKIFAVPAVLQVLQLVGFEKSPQGLVLKDSSLLAAASTALDSAIANFKTKQEIEYEERRANVAARTAALTKKQEDEVEQKKMELKKIKSIQSDVRERPVLASKADQSMGRSAAAQGIFAGAGGRSSSAKTFRDLGVDLNS